MTEIKFTGGPLRTMAFNKLKVFIANPGKFCLIVLGSRGSGKHFAIEKAFEAISKGASQKLCLEKLNFISATTISTDAKEIDILFKKHEYQTLIIEDVERFSTEQQDLFFTALSTTDGTFGINNKFNIRLVFTSSKEPDALRTDENHLQGLFWDRISQLVVEFPSYKVEKDNIVKDFYSTWDKMNFQKESGLKHFAVPPKNTSLQKFLDDYSEKFEGGFRDLDKLACMYFNYRIFYYDDKKKIIEEVEKKIVESIKDDFISKSQMHGVSGNDLSMFQIQPGFSMDDLIGQFKIQVRKWGKKEYNTFSKAEEKLELGKGTMKNWVPGKVTKSQRNNVLSKRKKK
jgi:hypothetical protein